MFGLYLWRGPYPKGLWGRTALGLVDSKAKSKHYIKNLFTQLIVANCLANYFSFTFIRFVIHSFSNESTNEVQRDRNIGLKF